MAADVDLDGKVDSSEFSGMIEVMKSNLTLIAELSFSFGVLRQKRRTLVRFPNSFTPDIQVHVSWGTRLTFS